jgi:metallophosphoesterase superfamily enzyme
MKEGLKRRLARIAPIVKAMPSVLRKKPEREIKPDEIPISLGELKHAARELRRREQLSQLKETSNERTLQISPGVLDPGLHWP